MSERDEAQAVSERGEAQAVSERGEAQSVSTCRLPPDVHALKSLRARIIKSQSSLIELLHHCVHRLVCSQRVWHCLYYAYMYHSYMYKFHAPCLDALY